MEGTKNKTVPNVTYSYLTLHNDRFSPALVWLTTSTCIGPASGTAGGDTHKAKVDDSTCASSSGAVSRPNLQDRCLDVKPRPVIVTVLPPNTDPLLGHTPNTDVAMESSTASASTAETTRTGSRAALTSKSTALLLTDTVIFPPKMKGRTHTTDDEDKNLPLTSPTIPSLQTRASLALKCDPMTDTACCEECAF